MDMLANFWIRGYRGNRDPSFHVGKGYWQDSKLVTFEWAMHPENFLKSGITVDLFCPTCGRPFEDPQNVIEDDYGKLYTMEEFRKLISSCPDQPRTKIGTKFE